MWSWALLFSGEVTMHPNISEQIHPGIITIQGMLRKIDCLRLPIASRRDVESILVRQVGREIDRALPWQAGHGRRTAAISLLIGQAVGLTTGELHDLKLAAFLHDIGLLMLPHDLDHRMTDSTPNPMSPCRTILGLAPHCSNRSSFSERLPSSSPTITNDGTDRAIRMASEDNSSPLAPGSSRSPTPSMPSASPKSRTESCEIRSLSELSAVAAGTQFDPELVEILRLFQESIPEPNLVEPTMGTVLIHTRSTGGFTMFPFYRRHTVFAHVVGRSSWIFVALLLVGCGSGSSTSAPPSVAATGTPGAQADVGERLFLETRFAQSFKRLLG